MKNKLKSKISKKAQLALLVIVAIIIITAIVVVYLYVQNPIKSNLAESNPQEYIKSCVKNSLEGAEKELIDNNFYPNIKDNYLFYNKDGKPVKVKYMCKASQFYMPCVNQEPMLVSYLTREIEKRVGSKTEECFSDLKKILRSKGYSVEEREIGNKSVEVQLISQKINLYLNEKITIKKGEDARTYNRLNVEMNSPLYDLADTARTILNYESELCEFNTLNWEKNFPKISITRFVTSDQSKVYILKDKLSGKSVEIAVKSCVLPAGI
jgi:hypothetical protein